MTPADGPATTVSRPETAPPLENLLFSAALVARRVPWADLPARTLGLDALTLDGLTRRLVAHLRDGRDDGRPVRLRTPFGTFLVPLTRADAEGLLTRGDGAGALGSPYGLAADGRRYGLSPHAEAGALDVLTEDELDGLTAQVAEHLAPVTAARREDSALDGDHWRDAVLRVSRHVVLGAEAVEDTLLSELVTAPGVVGGRSYEARAAAVRRRLAPYLADPGPGSLAGRLAARGQGASQTQAAVAHALALVSTATGTSALQALAVLAAGAASDSASVSPEEALDQALDQALDRYPPLSAVVYPVRAPFGGDGGPAIEAGAEILYAPALLGWGAEDGRTDPAWALCGNPSGCALARFAVLVGREVLRGITAGAHPVLLAPRFTADRLPETLDPRTVVVALGGPAAAPSAFGVPGQGRADRLEHHARSLAACAADSGWSGSEVGERFRVALLEHSDRCARAADDVRRAARRLSE